jgi:hypothetical protein
MPRIPRTKLVSSEPIVLELGQTTYDFRDFRFFFPAALTSSRFAMAKDADVAPCDIPLPLVISEVPGSRAA